MSERQINQETAEPISRLLPASRPEDGDEFALFRGDGESRAGYRIPYDRLVRQMVSDVSARFHLSSMAFRGREEYAEFDHTHDYQRVVCYPSFDPGAEDHPVRIMTVKTAGWKTETSVDVYMPNVDMPDPPRPAIGDVRLLALDEITAQFGDVQMECVHLEDDEPWTETVTMYGANATLMQSITDGTFDGWVYPDGSEYYVGMGDYDFSDAYRAFGGSGGVFKVPLLSGFMQMNPGLRLDDPVARMPGQLGLAVHTHELSGGREMEYDGTISAVLKMDMA